MTIKYYFKLMTNLIENVEPEDYDEIWEEFWELSKRVSSYKTIEWYDPDTTYYEDIMARYSAIEDYLEYENTTN